MSCGKVVVIGDVGVDRYHIGQVRGMSAEARIPILDQSCVIDLPGMGGNVIENLTSLGVDVDYLVAQGYGPTPIKNRLMANGIQYARWDEDDFCAPYLAEDLDRIEDLDALVIADYNKGSITPEFSCAALNFAENNDLIVFVDTKQNPSRWESKNVILFPNKAEAAKYDIEYAAAPFVVAKRGDEGMGLVVNNHIVSHLASYAKDVQCVNGAGDTTIAAFVSAVLRGYNLVTSLRFAAIAAGIVCTQDFLSRTVSVKDVFEIFHTLD